MLLALSMVTYLTNIKNQPITKNESHSQLHLMKDTGSQCDFRCTNNNDISVDIPPIAAYHGHLRTLEIRMRTILAFNVVCDSSAELKDDINSQ